MADHYCVHPNTALGAVVDCEHDLVVFRKLDDKKTMALERSATGHQLLPLAEDPQVQQSVLSLQADNSFPVKSPTKPRRSIDVKVIMSHNVFGPSLCAGHRQIRVEGTIVLQL